MLDFSNKNELRWLSQLVAAVVEAASSAPLLLIGAQARDLLLLHGHGIETIRATEDYDFAVAVRDWAQFLALRAALLAGTDFHADPTILHRLWYQKVIRVDLVPFGGVEDEHGVIAFPPQGDERMGVMGFSAAMHASLELRLPGGTVTRIVSIPALAVLKVFAWHERTAQKRPRDATDLELILRTYYRTMPPAQFYGHVDSLSQRPNFDVEAAGAWLLGRDASALLPDPRARERLTNYMSHQTDESGPLLLIAEMGGTDIGRNLRNLRWFGEGFDAAVSGVA